MFITTSNKVARILIRDEISTNILELREKDVERVLELCEKLGNGLQ